MAKFISLVQLKGGSGRSTIAVNLAGYFADKMPTGIIDADMPQGTAASWAALRPEQGALHVRSAENHQQLIDAAKELDALCRVVIIDTPPRTREITRAAMALSDLSLIPIGASASEVWASSDLVQVIEEARRNFPELNARLVWSRIKRGTNATKELTAAAAKELGLPALKTMIGNRTAYVEVMGRGLTVMQWHDQQARAELGSLIKEVTKQVKL